MFHAFCSWCFCCSEKPYLPDNTKFSHHPIPPPQPSTPTLPPRLRRLSTSHLHLHSSTSPIRRSSHLTSAIDSSIPVLLKHYKSSNLSQSFAMDPPSNGSILYLQNQLSYDQLIRRASIAHISHSTHSPTHSSSSLYI